MAKRDKNIDKIVAKTYEHGFVTDIESDTIAAGLNEDVVRQIGRAHV